MVRVRRGKHRVRLLEEHQAAWWASVESALCELHPNAPLRTLLKACDRLWETLRDCGVAGPMGAAVPPSELGRRSRRLVSGAWASRAYPGCPTATIMCLLDGGAGEGVLLLILLAMALSGATWWEHPSEQVTSEQQTTAAERLVTAALNATSAVPAPPRTFVSRGWRGIRGF